MNKLCICIIAFSDTFPNEHEKHKVRLTSLNMPSSCFTMATLDHPKCLRRATKGKLYVVSAELTLKKFGNIFLLANRGELAVYETWVDNSNENWTEKSAVQPKAISLT